MVYDDAADCELLILVDAADREVGYLGKSACHDGPGVLHRAFSLLIFNQAGELLLQQRAAAKRLWPHYWSNSVCSHPRRSEGLMTAIHRRLDEELGIQVSQACLAPFVFASHGYDSFHLIMPLYLCRRWEGPVQAREHEAIAWIKPNQMGEYPMPPADAPLVAWLRDLL